MSLKKIDDKTAEFEEKIIVEPSVVKELMDGQHDLGPDVIIAKSKQPILNK